MRDPYDDTVKVKMVFKPSIIWAHYLCTWCAQSAWSHPWPSLASRFNCGLLSL